LEGALPSRALDPEAGRDRIPPDAVVRLRARQLRIRVLPSGAAMTKADIDLAHRLVGELGHCVRAMEQYGNDRIASTMRNTISLLQKMVDENEQGELPLDDVDMTIKAMKAGHELEPDNG
jgi:hypothetical protein